MTEEEERDKLRKRIKRNAEIRARVAIAESSRIDDDHEGEDENDGLCPECGEELVEDSDTGDMLCPECDSPGVCISCDNALEYDDEYGDWFCPNHCSSFDSGILEDDYGENSDADSVCDDGVNEW